MPLIATEARRVLAAARAVLAASILRPRNRDGRGNSLPAHQDYVTAARVVAGVAVDDLDAEELVTALGEES